MFINKVECNQQTWNDMIDMIDWTGTFTVETPTSHGFLKSFPYNNSLILRLWRQHYSENRMPSWVVGCTKHLVEHMTNTSPNSVSKWLNLLIHWSLIPFYGAWFGYLHQVRWIQYLAANLHLQWRRSVIISVRWMQPYPHSRGGEPRSY